MMRMSYLACIAYALISVLYVVLFWSGQNPSIYVLLSFLGLQFFAVGFLFGNLRAIAMQPLGHIAGIGAAINGFISTVMAVPIANYIGRQVLALPSSGCGLSTTITNAGQPAKNSTKIKDIFYLHGPIFF